MAFKCYHLNQIINAWLSGSYGRIEEINNLLGSNIGQKYTFDGTNIVKIITLKGIICFQKDSLAVLAYMHLLYRSAFRGSKAASNCSSVKTPFTPNSSTSAHIITRLIMLFKTSTVNRHLWLHMRKNTSKNITPLNHDITVFANQA